MSQSNENSINKRIVFKGDGIEGELAVKDSAFMSLEIIATTFDVFEPEKKKIGAERIFLKWTHNSIEADYDMGYGEEQFVAGASSAFQENNADHLPKSWEKWIKILEKDSLSTEEIKEMLKELLSEIPCKMSNTLSCRVVKTVAEFLKEMTDKVEDTKVEDEKR